MRLENSLSCRDGLLPNKIVELAHPEERMAARLVERLRVSPPVDVEALCRAFAELSFKRFPVSIDGVCLDLKIPGKRPKVWVSTGIPPVRQRFTIAHEIGHIIIPWHTGTIVDEIDAPRSSERGRYREMEAEANRFAAELLMPSIWATGLSERADHVAGLMHSIHEIAEVSLPAAFLKAGKFGKSGYLGAETRDGIVVRSIRTPETRARKLEIGAQVASVKMPTAFEPNVIRGPDSTAYYWWEIRDTMADPGTQLESWRTILETILSTIPAEFRPQTRASINAIVGNAFGRLSRTSSVGEFLKVGLEASQNRERGEVWIGHVTTHASFRDYVLMRARERFECS